VLQVIELGVDVLTAGRTAVMDHLAVIEARPAVRPRAAHPARAPEARSTPIREPHAVVPAEAMRESGRIRAFELGQVGVRLVHLLAGRVHLLVQLVHLLVQRLDLGLGLLQLRRCLLRLVCALTGVRCLGLVCLALLGQAG
jgi:hypothetical protein